MSANPPPPPARFCPNCGNPLDASAGASNCSRCGASLAAVSTPPPPAYGYSGAPPARRGGLPGWLIGVIACVVAGPVLVAVCGIIAAIAVPSFLKSEARSKSMQAETGLQTIWMAEKVWAASHQGEYVEFDIDPTQPSNTEFAQLGVHLPSPLYHSYSAYYIDSTLWITAEGNVDDDTVEDRWELSSDDPTPYHYSDDVTDAQLTSHQPAPDDGIEGSTIQGGVVGGLGTAQATATPPDLANEASVLEAGRRAETARANLQALFDAEKRYRATHHAWMAFTRGSAATWAALHVTLPEKTNHEYSADVSGTHLLLRAHGNLDADAFEDAWKLDSDVGVALQEKSDLLNLDLSGDAPP